MSGAAISVVKAAAGLNSINLSSNVTLLPSGYYDLNLLTIDVGDDPNNQTPNHVNHLLFLSNASTATPYQYAFVNIQGTGAGVLSTTEQATVATTALIQEKALSYTTGFVYFYNATSGKVELLNNALSEVSMTN